MVDLVEDQSKIPSTEIDFITEFIGGGVRCIVTKSWANQEPSNYYEIYTLLCET